MPELNAIFIGVLAAMVLVGIVIGWTIRGGRAKEEKAAVNTGWQEQIDAQRSEHDRLTNQNKGLMEQIAQYQASNKDAMNRAKELADAIQEAYVRRDELQREIKDIRSNLEATMSERDQLQSDIVARSGRNAALDAKSAKIARLQDELANWQNRVPPLVERFRARNAEAEKLEEDLAIARERIVELEAAVVGGQTHIEPVSNSSALTNGRTASNDPLDDGVGSSDAGDDQPAEMRDELQRIKGIGPAIEKTLNEMGIFRFQQIANMSEYDIDRVANRLRGFHSRIYREDWIGQARNLSDQIISG